MPESEGDPGSSNIPKINVKMVAGLVTVMVGALTMTMQCSDSEVSQDEQQELDSQAAETAEGTTGQLDSNADEGGPAPEAKDSDSASTPSSPPTH